MAKALQEACEQQGHAFKVFSEHAPSELQISEWKDCLGIVDFSYPAVASAVAALAVDAKIPLVSGTTGWEKNNSAKEVYAEAATKIPVVWDSNFSLGIELTCQIAELLGRHIGSSLKIIDIHHVHKKDAPSGTALKLEKRFQEVSSQPVEIQSVREGEVFGEHRLWIEFGNENLEIVHRALSRQPFAAGALKALQWATKQRPGFYTMKEVLGS